jgi:hypothetical protein
MTAGIHQAGRAGAAGFEGDKVVENSNGHADGGLSIPDLLAEQLFTGKSTYSQLKKGISRAYWVRREGAAPAGPGAAGRYAAHSESPKP